MNHVSKYFHNNTYTSYARDASMYIPLLFFFCVPSTLFSLWAINFRRIRWITERFTECSQSPISVLEYVRWWPEKRECIVFNRYTCLILNGRRRSQANASLHALSVYMRLFIYLSNDWAACAHVEWTKPKTEKRAAKSSMAKEESKIFNELWWWCYTMALITDAMLRLSATLNVVNNRWMRVARFRVGNIN
jgi:hypothetical protein